MSLNRFFKSLCESSYLPQILCTMSKLKNPNCLPIGRYGHGVEGVSRVYRPVAGVGNGHDRGAEVRAGGQLGQPQHPCRGGHSGSVIKTGWKIFSTFCVCCILENIPLK